MDTQAHGPLATDTGQRLAVTVTELRSAYAEARQALLALREPDGTWRGELASSALATATAIAALVTVDRAAHAEAIDRAVAWLVAHQNSDGGWGDTVDSPSNLAAALLGLAALTLVGEAGGSPAAGARDRVREYLGKRAGTTPEEYLAALRHEYGADRTFAVPIQVTCALAGLIPWDAILPLPFELAVLPRSWFRLLRLHVVSYALPALIAIGHLIHRRAPVRNRLAARVREAVAPRCLGLLYRLQPSTGGFLEAVPLTSFVLLSLAGADRRDHPSVAAGVRFLLDTHRPDGSWPIDRDLATWVTSLSVATLTTGPQHPIERADDLHAWLRRCQTRERHPFTNAAPGGWPWSPQTGAVPDADDTAGALLALRHLGEPADSPAVRDGLRWLIDLQNSDGGWPTFCRGWQRLPFDRSTPDLTAHALRALHAWRGVRPSGRHRAAVTAGLRYLERTQSADGSWTPLWFGNQHTPDRSNPVYGTALVLRALADLGFAHGRAAGAGVSYLLRAQNPDGGWGGVRQAPSSREETGAVLVALCDWWPERGVKDACLHGASYVVRCLRDGTWTVPAPIGLYFARLWYTERLYPLVWTVAGLGQVLAAAENPPRPDAGGEVDPRRRGVT